MFTAEVGAARFTAPWDQSFDQRFTMLTRGSPRAAYFYEVPDTSTFRYRAYNVCQTLAAHLPGPSASWFHLADMEQIGKVLDHCDVLVLCRVRYDHRIAQLVTLARARGRRILFDVDDLVFDLDFAHTIIDTLGQDVANPAVWDYWYSYIGRLGATMRLCDGAVTTNKFLAARAEAVLGRPAMVIPNYINREQTELSSAIWTEKEASGWRRDGRINLGYFSGSPSHNRDFALIAPAVAGIMDRDRQVMLTVVGFLDDPGPDLARHRSRINSIHLQDFLNLQREIGKVEINLVPLQDNIFTNCKSELKWFEAAVVGSLTIATPTFTYRGVIEHGRNGWLARVQDWGQVLTGVLAMPEAERLETLVQARQDASMRFDWRAQAPAIHAALFG